MKEISLVIAIAVLIEALVEYAKKVKEEPILIGTIFLGVLVSTLFNVTLFKYLGMETNLYADIVLSGVILSRGSNYLSDFLSKITNKEHKQG